MQVTCSQSFISNLKEKRVPDDIDLDIRERKLTWHSEWVPISLLNTAEPRTAHVAEGGNSILNMKMARSIDKRERRHRLPF